MKTVRNTKHVERVPDGMAAEMVRSGHWRYCPKSELRDHRKRAITQAARQVKS